MAVKLNSYVSFNGNAAEAMAFYQSVFGGEVHSDFFRSFASDEMPVAEEDMDKIMHAFLKGDNGIELMASDAPSGMPVDKSSQISLSLSGNNDDEERLKGYWEKLSSDGGKVTLPLDTAPWSAWFGMCMDKFGINWMINIETSN